ncbi:MAG: hypothetical protein BAJALOKI1v1_1200008 [Promethearchaeota archaeon]|nr:MAG: hypothetical protein BAJALOKI1v1_1200008 [Candidatus Lokiarchaeota archaeon]
MRISLACNWKYELLNHIENENILQECVTDLYGTYDLSFTGSGRPFLLMQKKSKLEIEEYINAVHDLNLEFTWLWNGQCLGYNKFNVQEQSKALEELDWLDDIGVKYLTVSDPYLAQFARTYHPKLRLKVSVIAEVNSLTRALEWEEIIGSEGVLTLSVMVNRNLPLLKKIRDAVRCDIEILTNDCCLNDCPFRFFHYNECSHASQTHDALEGYYNDWATMACQNQKAFNPEQVIMCKWIQPSDLDTYMDIGIDYFKISGRRYGTEWLYRVLKAYSERISSRDLGKILNGYSFVSDPLELAGGQFSEFSAKQEKMGGGNPDDQGIMLSVPDFNSELLSERLHSFLQNLPFDGERCSENCGISCNYCFHIAEKAYNVPSEKKAEFYRNYMRFLYRYLNRGEIFLPKEERVLEKPLTEDHTDTGTETYTGIPWKEDAKQFFEEAMVLVPASMKKAATQGIGFTAERTAERQNLYEVNKQLLISIILRLIPQPFKHDFFDFLLEKKINPNDYMDQEDIDSVKKLPYGTDIMRKKAIEKGLDVPGQIINTNIEQKFENQQLNTKEVKKRKMDTKEEWEAYLDKFMKAYNELPDLKPLIEPVAPLAFQYHITDRPEMNYYQLIEKDGMSWGMGEYSGEAPILIHETSFETMKKVNSGESNPIQETMAGNYNVDGDPTKLMACAPLLPLNAKAHENAMK